MNTPKTAFLLALILAIAAMERWVGLSWLPPGNWYDEAINGLDALRILREPGWPLFFTTEGHPREPLYMYWIALVFSIVGVSVEALRGSSAALGVLGIWAAWFWTREVKRPAGTSGVWFALGVALILALMRWHVHFSRLGFRTILTPLLTTLVLGCAWRMAQTRSWRWGALCGGVLGIGMASYLTFRAVPLLLILVGARVFWMTRKKQPEGGFNFRDWRGCVFAVVLGFGVGGLPTWIDAALHPEHLVSRAGEVNPFSEGLKPGVRIIARQALDVGLKFWIRGDAVAQHNIPGSVGWSQMYWWKSPGAWEAELWEDAKRAARLSGQPIPDHHGHGLPVFDPLTSLFFLVGLILLLQRFRSDLVAFSIILWMALMALISIVSIGAPNLLRTVGMTPAVAFALMEGVDWARKQLVKRFGKRAGVVFLALFFLHFGVIEAKRYFYDWPRHPKTNRAFNIEFTDLGKLIQDLPEEVAVQVPDFIRHHPTFQFQIIDRTGVIGFEPEAPQSWITNGGTVLTLAPLPPYPPAPVSKTWLRSQPQDSLQILRLPNERPWAVLVPGPAK